MRTNWIGICVNVKNTSWLTQTAGARTDFGTMNCVHAYPASRTAKALHARATTISSFCSLKSVNAAHNPPNPPRIYREKIFTPVQRSKDQPTPKVKITIGP